MIEASHAVPQLPLEPVARWKFYRAYGLTIGSEIDLPELEPSNGGAADVWIRLRAIDRPKPLHRGNTLFEFGADAQYLAWHDVGAFLITDRSVIDVEPAPGVEDRLIAFPLLGPVLALLLHLRGLLVLHASAVAVGEDGVVFLGDKGAGKSTTASAMLAAGHDLLTDDLVAISFGEDGPMIAPGFPQLKLAQDAVNAIAVSQATVRPQAHPAIDKLQHRLGAGFAQRQVVPRRLYVLRRGREAAATPLPMDEALSAVMRFSYVVRFGKAALAGEAAARHLKHCAAVAQRGCVYQLVVPGELGSIGSAVRLIEDDVSRSGGR